MNNLSSSTAAKTFSEDVVEWALSYASRGWRVIAVNPPTKAPVDKGWQDVASADPDVLRQRFMGKPRLGLGIATGRGSEMVVIDVDVGSGKNGEAGLAFLEEEYGKLPKTVTARTPSGGRHLIFKYPAGVDHNVKNAANLGQRAFGGLTHVDLRGDGGQINVAPTSRGGSAYQWVTPLDHPIAELPPAWIELIVGGERTQPNRNAGPDKVAEGGRNNALASYLGGHRAKGADEGELIALAHAWNEANCSPPLDADEVERTVQSISKYPAGSAEHLTELGNSRRFVAKFGPDVRFTENGWMIFEEDRGNWQRDPKKLEAQRLMTTIAQDLREQARSVGSADAADAISKWANRSESASVIGNSLSLAPTEPTIRASVEDFDADAFSFAAEGALIDLRSGAARRPKREDLISNVSPVRYDATATSQMWDAFLDQIFDHDQDLIDAVQVMAGYFLTGLNREHFIWTAHGSGQNGKGVFFRTLRKVMGPYARSARRDTFVAKKNPSIPNDLAALHGGRLCVIDEFPQDGRPDEELLKQISGGDPVTARFLFKEDVTHEPAYKLVIVTNRRLPWTVGSFAIKRRLVEIPFSVTIPEAQKNPRLEEDLSNEYAGILQLDAEGRETLLRGWSSVSAGYTGRLRSGDRRNGLHQGLRRGEADNIAR